MSKRLHDLISLVRRGAALFRRGRRDRELVEEIEFHLAMRQRDFERAGAAPEAARLAARRQFGNVPLLKERTDDMWKFPSLESIVQDIRYAVRGLVKAPGFSVVAILVLAIGIGANTAMFSLVDAMLLRGLPYADSERLMVLIGNVQRTAVERRGNSLPDHRDWLTKATMFEGMAAYDTLSLTLSGSGEPERIPVEAVSAAYFSLLNVSPTHGRTFRAEEDSVPNRDYVAILSNGLWQRRFGADPSIVNSTIQLSGRAYTVVGIMPAGLSGITDTAQLWIPFALAGYSESRSARGFQTLAKLKAGASIEQARAELDVIAGQLSSAYPDSNAKRGVEVSPLKVETVGQLQPMVLTLMAAVTFVLLIACANVANLLIGRSEVRRKEIAVRTALGAGRARLMRQLITESCVLTLTGAAAGLALALLLMRSLTSTSPIQLPTFVQPALNMPVLLFAIGLAMAAGVLMGLAPAMHARVARLTDALKESARGGSGGVRAQKLRAALVVAEVALAIVLFIGAGLMIRSSQKLAAIDPGFDPSGLLTVSVSMPRLPAAPATSPAGPGQPAPPPAFVLSGRDLLERVRAVPGVTSVGLASDVPLTGGGQAVFYSAEGDTTRDAQTVPRAYFHRVSPAFFETLRMPLLTGRTFLDGEARPDAAVVIVSDGVAKRFWPGRDPIGKRIKLGNPDSTNPWLTIVGTVPETRYRALPVNPTPDPDLYLPALDRSPQPMMVRTSVPPESVLQDVRSAITRGQSSVAVFATATMADLVARQTAAATFTMWILGLFAVTALVLSTIGIYGVMSYLVAQRTKEFGIRLALGASRGEIVQDVLRHGATLIGVGAVIGIALAVGLAQVFGTLLYEVTALDVSSGVAVIALLAAALAACVVPAIRATLVDPVVALRNA